MELNICHLYPDLLNLYGDRGNVTALAKRCEWRDIAVNILDVSLKDEFIPEKYDVVFLGGGQDYEQQIMQQDLLEVKGDAIRRSVEDGLVYLCICGGYQLMGKYFRTHNGKEIRCLEAIDAWTIAGSDRMIGNIVFESELIKSDSCDGRVVGFENHSGRTYLGEGARPLGKVLKGYGNNGEDGSEGAVYKNVFCSYSHGSLLPKNPDLADYIIATALRRKYPDFEALPPLEDGFETLARNSMITRVISKDIK